MNNYCKKIIFKKRKDLIKEAKEKELVVFTVLDAGKTQVAFGTMTVAAIFGPVSIIDQVTGKLKLL